MHDSGETRFLLNMKGDEALSQALDKSRLERFIGVIYRPETERWSHYSSATLSRQFDAYVWFDETRTVDPLPTIEEDGPDDTFPFGF